MKAKLNKVDNGYVLLVDNIMYATDNDKLSKQNCDEIFGVIDVNMITSLLRKEFEVRFNIEAPEPKIQGGYWDRGLDYQCGVISGFNKAMELNKDKLFTLEDLRTAMTYGVVQEGTGFEGIHSMDDLFNLILRKVSQSTEIEVEIEYMFSVEENGEPTNTGITKLDENGCLILKRI
jgi:hypothetical protein